jgi:hypothetical protein
MLSSDLARKYISDKEGYFSSGQQNRKIIPE